MTAKKTILDYWFVLYDRRLELLIVLIATLGTTAFLSQIITPVYEGQASFYVPANAETPSYFSPDAAESIKRTTLFPLSDENQYAGYLGILKSEALAGRIVAEFPHKTVKNLIRKDIDFELDENLIILYARDHDGPTAAAIANTYVREFDLLMQEYSASRTMHVIKAISGRLDETQTRLASAEQVLLDIKQREGIVSMDDEIQRVVSQNSDFQTQRERTLIDLQANKRELHAIEARLKVEGELLDNQALLVVDSRLQNLQDRLLALETERIAVTSEVGSGHPSVLVLERQADGIREEMAQQAARVIGGPLKGQSTYFEELRQQLAQVFIRGQSLETSAQALDLVLERLAQRFRELAAIERELDEATETRDLYLGRRKILRTELQEAQMQYEQPVPAVVQVDVAGIPAVPIFPIMWLNLLVGCMLGLVAGVYYCFFADYLESTRQVRILRLLAAVRRTDPDSAVALESVGG